MWIVFVFASLVAGCWADTGGTPANRRGGNGITAAVHAAYVGCDESKGCFVQPSNCLSSRSCSMMVTYKRVSETQHQLELYGVVSATSEASYVAVAFSRDEYMVDIH